MKTYINLFTVICLGLAVVFLSGMEGCAPEEDPAVFVSATPPDGSTLEEDATIVAVFDAPPSGLDVDVPEGVTFSLSGTTVTITGGFTPGSLNLLLTWAGGAKALSYTVEEPKTTFDSADPPSGSTITPFTDVVVTFVGEPEGLWLTHPGYNLERSGNTATILGNFEAGHLELNLVWEDGTHDLRYTVSHRPIAEVQNVWVDHNVFEGGVKGMRIHVKFRVANPFNGRILAYFHLRDGDPLRDFNGRFRTVDGEVSVGRDFNNPHALGSIDDFPIFMPYSELHRGEGFHRLEFHVRVWDKGGDGFVDEPRYKAVYFTLE